MKAYRDIDGSFISILQSEPFEATVVDFYVHHDDRGKGIGKQLLESTCRDADWEGVTLYLEPLPFGAYDTDTETFYPPTLTFKQLCSFYRQFGFRFQPAPVVNRMMRKPKKRN